nr:hypothetical protein [Klebsiella pneumoniae]
ATRVDIWTDVPGIYTTDPRVAPAANDIDVIAFEEAAEMATRVDIWTDVPGIYTTDPRVAPAANDIDVIAFE